MVACMIFIVGSMALAFGLHQSGIFTIEIPEIGQKRKFNQPPPGATVPLAPGDFLFDLFITNKKIMIPRGGSLSTTVSIFGRGEANVSLSAGIDDVPPEVSLLPTGIEIVFDSTSLVIETDSTTTVNLTISIGNEAIPGTYKLVITGTQRTNGWVLSHGIPFEITVM